LGGDSGGGSRGSWGGSWGGLGGSLWASCIAKIVVRAAPAALLATSAFFRARCHGFSCGSSSLISDISSQLYCGTWCSGGPSWRGLSNKPLRYLLPPLSLIISYI
jgi:hypothetical protein